MHLINYQNLIIVLLLLAFQSAAQPLLEKGEYSVGFKMEWIDNPNLSYSMEDGIRRNNKPVLLGIWYPARENSNDPLSVHDYMSMKGLEGKEKIQEAFFKNEENSWKENPASYITENKDIHNDCYTWLIDNKGYAKLDALPLDSKFPVIIYEHGGGCTYNENLQTFEYLASHGYVVISSQFWTLEYGIPIQLNWYEAKSDLQCIVSYLKELPNADVSQLAFMGHSQGAQYGYGMMIGATPFKAFIPLDPTWHAYGLEKISEYWGKEHVGMLELLKLEATNMYPEILEISGLFEPDQKDIQYDSLLNFYEKQNNGYFLTKLFKHSDRHLMTIGGRSSDGKEMDHDSFISQGALAYSFLSNQKEFFQNADPRLLNYFESQHKLYKKMNHLILLFLNKVLKPTKVNVDKWVTETKKLENSDDSIRYQYLPSEYKFKEDEFWWQLLNVKDTNLDLLQQLIKEEIDNTGRTSFKYIFAIMMNHKKNPDLAYKVSDIHMKLENETWYTYFVHANLLYHTGHEEKAILFYEKSLETAPSDHKLTKKMNRKEFSNWSAWQ